MCKYHFELKLPAKAILPLDVLYTLRVLLEVVFVGVIFPLHMTLILGGTWCVWVLLLMVWPVL